MGSQIAAAGGDPTGEEDPFDLTMGDPEYLTAFDELILPAAASFAPDLIVVSAGFDAAEGDPLGTYHLSPTAYAHMTRRLQALPSSEGRVVAVLEGGYNLESISASASAVCTALRGAEDAPCVQPHTTPPPKKSAVDTIGHALAIHRANGLLRDVALTDSEAAETRAVGIVTDAAQGAQRIHGGAAVGPKVSKAPKGAARGEARGEAQDAAAAQGGSSGTASRRRSRSKSPTPGSSTDMAPLARSSARRASGAGGGAGRSPERATDPRSRSRGRRPSNGSNGSNRKSSGPNGANGRAKGGRASLGKAGAVVSKLAAAKTRASARS